MEALGRVAELWRYPVKSMRGERCAALAVGTLGVAHDRRYAFESAGAPPGKPLLRSAERTRMLLYAATVNARGGVMVRVPDGRSLAVDDPALIEEMASGAAPLETPWLRHEAAPFTDVRPIALHSAATVRGLELKDGAAIDGQRLRSNLVLELAGGRPFAEDALAGLTLRLGDVELRILERIPRCRMVSLDPETAVADPEILRWLARQHDGRAGVYARCVRPGVVRVGDAVWLAE